MYFIECKFIDLEQIFIFISLQILKFGYIYNFGDTHYKALV